MALLNANSKLIVVLVLVIALMAFLVGVLLALPLSVISLDTKTHVDDQFGWQGCGLNPNGEALDASTYVTSWSTTGTSEKIVPLAGVRWHGLAGSLDQAQWNFYITKDGLIWSEASWSPVKVTLPNVIVTGGCVALPIPPQAILGQVTGGIRADLQVHVLDWKIAAHTFIAVSDQAYLIPGVGKINAPGQAQVGDTITVSTIVGYVTSEITPGKGWQFWGYSVPQRKYVVGPVELTDLQQSFSYKLVPADFSVSAGCSTPNRIEWHLLNELWEKDFALTTTIDVSAFAPTFTLTGYTGDPVNGGNVTLQFHAAPNPTTQQPVLKVVVAYGFGGISNEKNLTGNATSLPIPLGQGGNLHVEAYAVDSACRPSPPARLDISVREPGQNNQTGVKPNWLVFAVVLVLVAAVGVAIAYSAKGAPVWARVLLLVFFLVLGLLLAVVMVPAVLNPSAYSVLAILWRLTR